MQNRSNLVKLERRQYKISSYKVENMSKEYGKNILLQLQSDNSKITWKKVNLLNIFEKGKLEDFILNNIVCSGFHPKQKQYSKIVSQEPFYSDFIFFDFDNKDGQMLRFEMAYKILEASNYNYILTTSQSHMKDLKTHKLHIMIPVYLTIKSNEEHKKYCEEFLNKFFKGYKSDSQLKTLSSRMFPGNKDTFRIKYKFNRNDFHINFKPTEKKILNQITKDKMKQNNNSFDDEALLNYSKMVQNSYGIKVSKEHCDNKTIRYHRNDKDLVPSMFSSHNNEQYSSQLIFDNRTKSNGKNREFRPLFSYEDFKKRIDANSVKVDVRNQLTKEGDNFFNSKIIDWRFVLTNEGVGKSFSILILGKTYKFIYVTHTKNKLNEVEKDLKELNIEYIRISSTEEILEINGISKSIRDKYKIWIQKNENKTLKIFFDELLEEYKNTDFELYEKICKKVSNILNQVIQNNKKINEDKVIIMTSKKLEVFLKKGVTIDKPIVFDEFNVQEWYRYSDEQQFEHQRPSYSLPKSWNSLGIVPNNNWYFYEKKSFLDLLQNNKVLVLSTERRLLEDVFYNTKFQQLSNTTYEFKLKSENILYFLVNSTSNDHKKGLKRDQIYKQLKKVGTVICNGLKKEDVKTHLSLKGLNNYSNEDLVIIGSLKPELAIKTHLINCFDKYKYLIENDEYFRNQVNDLKNFKYDKNIEFIKYHEKLFNFSESIIQNILMETEISQSIGRNQGFRAKGKNTIVIIPALMGNTSRKTKDLRFNYISSNVFIMTYNENGLIKQNFRENGNDDLKEKFRLIPYQYENKFTNEKIRKMSENEIKSRIKSLNYENFLNTIDIKSNLKPDNEFDIENFIKDL